MAFTLYTGEMIQALRNAGRDDVAIKFEEEYRQLNESVALVLAVELDIKAEADQQIEDGRFASTFEPTFDGQKLPKAIADFDEEDEWEEHDNGLG